MSLDSWKNRKKVETFVSAQPNPAAARRILENLYENAPVMNGVRVGPEYTIIESISFNILKTSEIVWVFHYSNQVKLYGVIPTTKAHAIKLRTEDGQEYGVLVPTNGAAENLLKFLFERLPGAAFGYSSELASLWDSCTPEQRAVFHALGQKQHGG